MTNTLTVVYGETTLQVAAGTSLNEIKASMAQIFPELKNSEAVLNGSTITFNVKAGTKGSGSLTVVYGETTLTVAEGTSLNEIKASMAQIFPELKNSEVQLNGSTITFNVKAGTKGSGSLTVVYGETTLQVAEGTSLNEIKASMAQIFPELKNSEAVLNGSTITFNVKAGTKGSDSLTVVYGETTLQVAAGTSLNEIKASMAQIFPELKNSEAVLNGSTITFNVKAGTKGSGSLTVVYGETTLQVAEGTSLNEIKASMAQIFPELKNSEAVLNGSTITFNVKAGTKGF